MDETFGTPRSTSRYPWTRKPMSSSSPLAVNSTPFQRSEVAPVMELTSTSTTQTEKRTPETATVSTFPTVLPMQSHRDDQPDLVAEFLPYIQESEVSEGMKKSDPSISSNADLDELEKSMMDMQQFVEDLQLEVMKFRHDVDSKREKPNQIRPKYQEFIHGLEQISGTLEAHKMDYSMVTETQAENVELRKAVLRLTEEVSEIEKEIEQLKLNHASEMLRLTVENEETVKQLNNRFNADLEKERSIFVVEKETWDEEKAKILIDQAAELAVIVKKPCPPPRPLTPPPPPPPQEPDFKQEILRQISEIQNQSYAQVAELQTRIEELAGSRESRDQQGRRPTSTSSNRSRAQAGQQQKQPQLQHSSPTTTTPISKKWMPQEVLKNSPFTRLRPHVSFPTGERFKSASYGFLDTPPLPPPPQVSKMPPQKRPLPPSYYPPSKVMAVPPVCVVVSGERHPLLDANDSPLNGELIEESPNSRWGKTSDTIYPLPQKGLDTASFFQVPNGEFDRENEDVNFISPDDWFPYEDEATQPDPLNDADCLTQNLSEPTQAGNNILTANRWQEPRQKRHIFTVQSGNA